MARILVAEDDPRMLTMVRQRLQIEGFRVLEAGFARLPIVVMTGTPRSEVEQKARSLDCTFLAKPSSPTT